MKSILTIVLLIFSLCVFTQPAVDEGMYFNGIDAYNHIPNTPYINGGVANKTVELSFKADGVTNRQVLYEEGGTVNAAVVIYIEAGFIVVGEYKFTGAGAPKSLFYRSSIAAATWYHVAITLGTTGGVTTLKWYLNGVLQSEPDVPDAAAFSLPEHLGDINLGKSGDGLRYPATWTVNKSSGNSGNANTAIDTSDNFFTGLIWGFRVWNAVPRTQAQINDNKNTIIANETNTGTGLNLVAYMPDTYDRIRFKNSDGDFVDALSTNTTATLSVKDYDYLAKEVTMYSVNNVLFINSNLDVEIKNIKIFSYLGKELFASKFTNEINLPSFSKSVYFVLFELENGLYFSKKILL